MRSQRPGRSRGQQASPLTEATQVLSPHSSARGANRLRFIGKAAVFALAASTACFPFRDPQFELIHSGISLGESTYIVKLSKPVVARFEFPLLCISTLGLTWRNGSHHLPNGSEVVLEGVLVDGTGNKIVLSQQTFAYHADAGNLACAMNSSASVKGREFGSAGLKSSQDLKTGGVYFHSFSYSK